MNNVSANVLFHYTSSFKNLESIIQNRFKIAYSLEEISFGEKKSKYAFPMVCFCDLPLRLAKNHIETYGYYAIGLKKSWGSENKLNPVLYVENNSKLSEHFGQMHATVESYLKTKKKGNNDILDPKMKVTENMMFNFFNILRFLKNYNNPNSYPYYDEREWRYVPEYLPNNKNCHFRLSEDQFLNLQKSSNNAKPFAHGETLKFQGTDIECVIVKSIKEIPKIIDCIRNAVNLNTTVAEADVLTTKIFTIEQLNNYF